MPLRLQRVDCLRKLQLLSQLFETASPELSALYGESGENLLHNFINAELRELSMPRPEIDDKDLEIQSLRAMWQYVFLLRSEFIRVAVFSLVSSTRWLSPKRLLILLKFTLISSIPLRLSSPGSDRNSSPKNYGQHSALPPLQLCKIQLEWVLERLNHETDLPNDPSMLVNCLQNVLSILQSPTDSEKDSPREPENEQGFDGEQTEHDECRVEKEKEVETGDDSNNEEYQVKRQAFTDQALLICVI